MAHSQGALQRASGLRLAATSAVARRFSNVETASYIARGVM